MKRGVMVAVPSDDDLSDRIVLSVRTKGFESEVSVPVPLAPGAADEFVKSWLAMMDAALKMPHAVKAA